ncbi:MAG: hypothetical protein Q9201_002508 [Fulgogasparrea decipioides]
MTSDALSENESLTKLSLHTEHRFTRVDDILTVSGQSLGPLYCYGTEDGLALLCEVGRGKVCELERLTSYMSIEQAAWSEGGSLVAIADLSGRLSIKRIAKAGQARDTWQVKHELDLAISPHEGHIGQLVFQPAGHQLLASMTKTLYSVDLKSHDLVTAKVPPGLSKHISHLVYESRSPFLSHKGLVFLDVDRWICTWRLPSSAPRRRSEVDGREIGEYYFLPGDWVTANEGQLSTVMPNGTFLCPQNGEVAAVQCVKLRKQFSGPSKRARKREVWEGDDAEVPEQKIVRLMTGVPEDLLNWAFSALDFPTPFFKSS